MSPAFDGSIHEIFSALCHGATLILPAGDNVFEALDRATSAILTPSVAEVLDPDRYPALKHVYLVGEPVKQAVNDLCGASKVLYNMYRPTEGTCGATIKRLFPGHAVTIRRPNPSTRVYILNGRGQFAIPGMIGEIYTAGVQVARGYIGKPEMTAERFLLDTVCPAGVGLIEGGEEYMYKTGDRGYWTSDGEIVCLGRTDRQIKLRGFRLDLNDLEIRVAQAVPELKSVAIAPRDDFLVAAIQPSSLNEHVVAELVARVLPVYAQPRYMVFVDEFPMTLAGKLNYKEMLSDGFIDRSIDKTQLRTPMEVKVASIWRQLLKLDRSTHVGPRSSFLQLGGNSMLQMTLVARLSSILMFRVPLKIILESQSLAGLASRLNKLQEAQQSPSLRRSQTLGPSKLSPIEQDWWSRYKLDQTTTNAFNVSFVAGWNIQENNIDLAAMADAWDSVMSRYSIFRGRYIACGSAGAELVERRYVQNAPRVIRVHHIDVWSEVNTPFDLARTSAIRVSLAKDTLVVTMSHIVGDLTTLKILLREVQVLYEGKQLPPVRHTYEDSVVWEDEAALCDLKFWSSYLDGYDPGSQFAQLETPLLSERRSYRGRSNVYRLSDGLAAGMLAFAERQEEDVSLQQLAIAAVAVALQSQTETTDIVIGSPFINHANDADMETVGLFLEPLPVRIKHTPSHQDGTGDSDARSFLNRVHESANAALGHAVPWHKLLEHLDISPQYPNHPLFDVMVTFHYSSNAVELELPGIRVIPLHLVRRYWQCR